MPGPASPVPYLLGPEQLTDPYPRLAELRQESGAVCRVVLPDGMPVWLVLGYEEARQVLSDPRMGRSIKDAAPELHQYMGFINGDYEIASNILRLSPPEHTRLRRLVTKVFPPDLPDRLRPRIEHIVNDLLDVIAPAGEGDLVTALAAPMPLRVNSLLLGVPSEDGPLMRRYTNALFGMNGVASQDDVRASMAWFNTYIRQLVAARQQELGGDLISALLSVRDGTDRLTEAEVRSTVFVLTTGGFDTVINLVAHGVLALLRRPSALAALYSDPGLIPRAVDELLRYTTPPLMLARRFPTCDITIGGQQIRRGDHVVACVGAANRDPTRFPEPDTVDIRRPNAAAHLSFGHGIHYCLGARLGRLIGQVTLSTLLRRFTDLTLAVPADRIPWRPSVMMHGPQHVPVTFTARPETNHA